MLGLLCGPRSASLRQGDIQMIAILRIALAALLLLVASGCSTEYGKMGLTGGVDAEPVSNDTYRITALGNGFTSPEQIQDYALLKAAETALAQGQTYFTILGDQNETTNAVGQTPGTLSMNTFGTSTFATYNPGISYDIIKPGQDVMIRVWTPKKGDVVPPNSFDAQEVFDNINPRVKRSK